MIKVITNSNGSGDWVVVRDAAGEVLHSGHNISPFDLVMILQNIGVHAEFVSVTDLEIEAYA